MITSIRLQNFRSYEDSSFEFEAGVNIIIGPNTSGKTNLLEALLLLCKGGSYRNKLEEVIRHNQPWARLDAFIAPDQKRVLKIEAGKTQPKSFEINDKLAKRLSFEQKIPTILFEPNQLQLLTTSPEQRRQFIDELLEQTDNEFASHKRAYMRIIAQRNNLLKRHPTNLKEQIFVWNLRMSEFAASIVKKRLELIEKLNRSITENYRQIAMGKDTVLLSYQTSCNTSNYATSLLKKLEDNLQQDLQRGFTNYGPHRDDINVELNDRNILATASRGEIRSLLLALKFEEVKLVEAARAEKPILLLDDVFGELDARRRKSLTEFLMDYQSFITTTDADVVQKNFTKNSNIIALEN